MLAEKNEAIKEAETTMRKLNADERIKMQCEAREQIEHDMASAYQHGVDEGEKRGRKEREDRFSRLLQKLMDEEEEDLSRVIADYEYREKLYKKYGL